MVIKFASEKFSSYYNGDRNIIQTQQTQNNRVPLNIINQMIPFNIHKNIFNFAGSGCSCEGRCKCAVGACKGSKCDSVCCINPCGGQYFIISLEKKRDIILCL